MDIDSCPCNILIVWDESFFVIATAYNHGKCLLTLQVIDSLFILQRMALSPRKKRLKGEKK